MKKILALCLALLMLAGCGAPAAPAAAPVTKLGLGLVTSMKSSKDATEEANGQVQVDTTIITAVFDDKGTILALDIDVAQSRGAFTLEGKLDFDKTVAVPSKIEKGDAYNMKPASAIGKEYFEQIAALKEYMIGKNVQDVLNMPTYKRDDAHTNVPDVAELKSSCTITVQDYLAALEKAYANAK